MKKLALILTVAALAACGADGEPLTPNASFGVGVGTDGITSGARVGASNSNISVSVGT